MGYIEQSLGANEAVHYRARLPFILRAFGWLVLLGTIAAAATLYAQHLRPIAAAAGIAGGVLFLMIRIPILTTESAVTNHRIIFKRGLVRRATAGRQLRA